MDIIIGNNSVILRNMLSELLTEAGNNIVCLTSDGNEIISEARKSNVDLIILGENLSHASEKEVITKVESENSVPIIFMGDESYLNGAKPTKILPKPDMGRMGDEDYHNELLKQISLTISSYSVGEKTTKRLKQPHIDHIVIGSSTGGPNALKALLDELPENFPVPISIVQHMEKGHEEGLANWLNKSCKLNVRLAVDNDNPVAGEVIMGEQGKHLSVINKKFYLTDEEKVQFQKPAVDVLFTTAAKSFGKNLLGVLLTGMGRDGANGCLDILNSGGETIVQDEKTSTVYGMPKAASELNAASIILPLHEIPEYILSVLKKSKQW